METTEELITRLKAEAAKLDKPIDKIADEIKSVAATTLHTLEADAQAVGSGLAIPFHDLEAKALGIGSLAGHEVENEADKLESAAAKVFTGIKTDVFKIYGNATDLDKPLQEVLAKVEKDTVKEEMDIKSDVVSTYGVVYRFFHKIKSTLVKYYYLLSLRLHTWF